MLIEMRRSTVTTFIRTYTSYSYSFRFSVFLQLAKQGNSYKILCNHHTSIPKGKKNTIQIRQILILEREREGERGVLLNTPPFSFHLYSFFLLPSFLDSNKIPLLLLSVSLSQSHSLTPTFISFINYTVWVCVCVDQKCEGSSNL